MTNAMNTNRRFARVAMRAAIAAGCALLLSGCVVYPARPYGYYYGAPAGAYYGPGYYR